MNKTCSRPFPERSDYLQRVWRASLPRLSEEANEKARVAASEAAEVEAKRRQAEEAKAAEEANQRVQEEPQGCGISFFCSIYHISRKIHERESCPLRNT